MRERRSSTSSARCGRSTSIRPARRHSRNYPRLSGIERAGFGALLALALGALYTGWRLTWFLTDDAFITFRYAANSLRGFGYVWNAPPFRPVEGYSSFLWLLLLDGTWRLTGVAPPESAPRLGLFFTALTLLLGAAMLWQLRWRPALRPWRLAFLALFLVGVVGNRTFLTWSSSGLETGLFNFTITLWLYSALYLAHPSPRGTFVLAFAAALAALTRPDGLLFAAASAFVPGVGLVWRARRGLPLARFGLAALPLLAVPAHLLWRRSFYGEWLPNTYYAKVTHNALAWESGTRYLLSFLGEYFLWSWGVVAALVLARSVARRAANGREPPREDGMAGRWLGWVALGALAAHAAYYTFVTGGDHFEFRVYSHLVLPLMLALAWMVNRLGVRPAASLSVMALAVALTMPLPWYHWHLSQRYQSHREALMLKIPLASIARDELNAPGPVVAYLKWFDAQQAWLIDHFVGMRQREHLLFYQQQIQVYEPYPLDMPAYREDGALLVALDGTPGVHAYRQSHVAIIDMLGLNDRVIARNPDLREGARMGHERQPPPGYVECLMGGAGISLAWVTPERIIECEGRFSVRVAAP